jgi:hypothetical protein
MAGKWTEWPQNIPTWSLQNPPKFTQIGIFGWKTYHLATLAPKQARSSAIPNNYISAYNFIIL